MTKKTTVTLPAATVEALLDAMENLTAITSVIGPNAFQNREDWEAFAQYRTDCSACWSAIVAIVDKE